MQLTRIARENTPKRWRAALKRAMAEGVEIRQLQGSGMWIATSASDPDTAYEVTPWECECHAGQFQDPVCKHRAALLVKLGRLQQKAEFQASQTTPCPACGGTGVNPHALERVATSWSEHLACPECHGRGFVSSANAA